METIHDLIQTAETTCTCSFCNKVITQNEKFIPFDVHALVGAQVCKQYFNGLSYQQDNTKISFFSPIAKRKANLCNDCYEKNQQYRINERKNDKKIIVITATVLFVIFVFFLIFSIISSWSIAFPIVSGIFFIIVGLIALSEIKDKGEYGPSSVHLIFTSTFMDTDPTYKNFIKTMNSKINFQGINFSSFMFGVDTVPLKKATHDENLLYIYDFKQEFGENIYAWFKYGGRYWYKMNWDHSKYIVKGFNGNGVPDAFRTIFCFDKIEPTSIGGIEIKYENNNFF
ncbi:MAG: hypothetical protein PHT69_15440 [Bacteroidales bacterium]|nr:hypothetical protein [Bacteroidales bacterium]